MPARQDSANVLKMIKKCHEKGFEYVSQALTADENGTPNIALYSHGVTQFRTGLRITEWDIITSMFNAYRHPRIFSCFIQKKFPPIIIF